MGDDAIPGVRRIMLHHDDNGNTLDVKDPDGRKVEIINDVTPDWVPPGQILKCCHIIQLIKAQESPACWYIIVGGRAYKICQ